MISYIYQNLIRAQEDCYRIGEALKANNCLRKFHLTSRILSPYPGFSIITEHLCRNETLNEVTIDLGGGHEGELQLCVSSIQYFTSFRAENHAEEASPPQQNVFPPGLSPYSTVLHTKHVFLTACTVH